MTKDKAGPLETFVCGILFPLSIVGFLSWVIVSAPGCSKGNRYTDKITEGETKIDFFQSPRMYVYAGVPLTLDSRTAITITKKDGNFIQYEDRFGGFGETI